jgi:hypothetical protein
LTPLSAAVSSTSVVTLPRCAETTVTGQRWCSKTGAKITLMSRHVAAPVLLFRKFRGVCARKF